jgi:hypothetical protein
MADPTTAAALVELLDDFDAGEYDKILKKRDGASTLLPPSLLWHALVETKDYAAAAQVTEITPSQTLYLDYQRGQYKTILINNKENRDDDSVFGQALYAQSLYHLGQYGQAADAFFRLARNSSSTIMNRRGGEHNGDNDPVVAMKAWTNGISCWSADATKTSLSNDADEAIVTEILAFLESHNEPPYELQYTLASFLMTVRPSAKWIKLLEKAKASCDTEDDDDVEVIETNLSYVFGSKVQTQRDNASQNPVRLANADPLALEGVPPKEWTPRQRLTLLYNQALVKKQKGKDFSKECKELKSAKAPFWHVRALMLENDSTAIDEFMRTNTENDPESTLFATFYLAHQQTDPLAYLRENLPKHVLEKPGLQYAMMSTTASSSSPSSATTNMVDVYEKNKNVDEASFARWVRALSQSDPARAVNEWKQHTVAMATTIDMPNLDPEELEARRERPRSLPAHLPRSTGVAESTATNSGGGGGGTKANQKSKDAILRYRAKKRAEYIARKNIPPHKTPNPNRWVSQKQTAAQGSVGGATLSAKYDVANRQATANSTAHLGVKGQDRKGVGKRR